MEIDNYWFCTWSKAMELRNNGIKLDTVRHRAKDIHKNESPQRFKEYPEIKSPGDKQKSRETRKKGGGNNITASCLNLKFFH